MALRLLRRRGRQSTREAYTVLFERQAIFGTSLAPAHTVSCVVWRCCTTVYVVVRELEGVRTCASVAAPRTQEFPALGVALHRAIAMTAHASVIEVPVSVSGAL